MSKQIKVVGMAWYKEEDYGTLRDLFEDGDKLPLTYAQWLQKAQSGFDELTASGHLVVKAYIDPESFGDWCHRAGYGVNAEGRKHFASSFAFDYIKAKQK